MEAPKRALPDISTCKIAPIQVVLMQAPCTCHMQPGACVGHVPLTLLLLSPNFSMQKFEARTAELSLIRPINSAKAHDSSLYRPQPKRP